MRRCIRTTKVCHNTKARAERALTKLARRGDDWRDKRTLEAYHCRHCQEWHVGHSFYLATKLGDTNEPGNKAPKN